jgi:hypothetical protein
MTELVPDPGQALELLLSLSQSGVNPTALVRALADVVHLGAGVGDSRVSDAVERALAANAPPPWDRPEVPAFEYFPRVPGVRERALERLDDRDAPLASIAYGFGQDVPMREALAIRLRPLDVALRGRLIARVAELPASNETAQAILARHDAEPHPGIKIAAATAHARRAKESGNVDDALVQGFVDQARALGPDLDDRRAAAFCALAELGRLDLLAQQTEPLGEFRPLRLGRPVFGGKPEFYRTLCRHWGHVESALGRDFPGRFGYGDGENVEFLENVLAVAHDYPNTHNDLASVLTRLPQLRTTGPGIRYMWRTNAPRDQLWHSVSTVIEGGHALSYAEARPIITALHVLTEAFHDDPRTTTWLDTIAAGIERRHHAATGQRRLGVPGYGVTAALARLRPQDPLVGALLTEAQPAEGRPWYYFHQWSELVLASASDPRTFVDGATRLAEIVRLNDDFADYIHQPVAARLRRAPQLAAEVAALVPELSGPAWGIAVRGLALGGHIDGELQEHLRHLVERPEQHLTTFDPLTATVCSARLLALEILDSTEQTTPVW